LAFSRPAVGGFLGLWETVFGGRKGELGMHTRFETLDVSLELITSLRPLLPAVARRDRSLLDQLRRAATSVASNVSEGNRRVGKDRVHLFRVAAGSAAEVQSQLEIAIAWGDIEQAAAKAPLELVDRVLAMLWKLTR
jgi:four helix bundle protein